MPDQWCNETDAQQGDVSTSAFAPTPDVSLFCNEQCQTRVHWQGLHNWLGPPDVDPGIQPEEVLDSSGGVQGMADASVYLWFLNNSVTNNMKTLLPGCPGFKDKPDYFAYFPGPQVTYTLQQLLVVWAALKIIGMNPGFNRDFTNHSRVIRLKGVAGWMYGLLISFFTKLFANALLQPILAAEAHPTCPNIMMHNFNAQLFILYRVYAWMIFVFLAILNIRILYMEKTTIRSGRVFARRYRCQMFFFFMGVLCSLIILAVIWWMAFRHGFSFGGIFSINLGMAFAWHYPGVTIAGKYDALNVIVVLNALYDFIGDPFLQAGSWLYTHKTTLRQLAQKIRNGDMDFTEWTADITKMQAAIAETTFGSVSKVAPAPEQPASPRDEKEK